MRHRPRYLGDRFRVGHDEKNALVMAASGALLPYRSERERPQRVGYDAFAKSSGNDRNLRIPSVPRPTKNGSKGPARRAPDERPLFAHPCRPGAITARATGPANRPAVLSSPRNGQLPGRRAPNATGSPGPTLDDSIQYQVNFDCFINKT